jgi:adenylosuccinate synthase
LRYAVRVNGITHLAITKLDVLDGFTELKLCCSYRLGDGTTTRDFPTRLGALEHATPIYESLPGWARTTAGVRRWSDLPPEAIVYLSRIEECLQVPAALLGIGAERTATFTRLPIWESL